MKQVTTKHQKLIALLQPLLKQVKRPVFFFAPETGKETSKYNIYILVNINM
jgi:hypothetical protein